MSLWSSRLTSAVPASNKGLVATVVRRKSTAAARTAVGVAGADVSRRGTTRLLALANEITAQADDNDDHLDLNGGGAGAGAGVAEDVQGGEEGDCDNVTSSRAPPVDVVDTTSELLQSQAQASYEEEKEKVTFETDAGIKMEFRTPEADFVIDSNPYENVDRQPPSPSPASATSAASVSANAAESVHEVTIPEIMPPQVEEVKEIVERRNLPVLVERRKENGLSLKQVLSFSIPALAGILTDPLMSFVDTACVGRMSSTELAAMGPNTAIYNFVLQIFTCFIVYTCGQVSKLSSSGAHERVFKLVSHALVLGVITGVLVAGGLIGFSNPLLASMDTLPELMAPAASYLKIRALSLPAVLVCMISGAFCLGRKDSRTPLLVAIASTITNLLGDIVLIFGPAKMGISGAALATTASVYVGAAYFLFKVSSQIPLKFLLPGWKEIKPFLTTSSMLTIRNMSIMINYVAMTMVVGSYGTIAAASHQVAISIFMIGNLAAEPFSQCAQSFLASIGSKKKRSLDEHKYLIGAMKLLVATGVACGVVMGLASSGLCLIPSLFTTNPLIAGKVGFAAPIVGWAVGLSCVNCVSDGFIFASHDYKYSAITAVVNIPLLLLILNMGKKFGFGWWSVWVGMAAFYTIRLVENSLRIIYLNNKRLSKAKLA